MRSSRTIAAAYLAIGFAIVTAIAVFVERGMGFRQFADFFDPVKIVDGLGSAAWRLEGILYLGFGVALVYLACLGDDAYRRSSGVTAGAAIFLVGCVDRMLALATSAIGDVNQLHIAILGVLVVRFAALRLMVFALGVFAWRTSVAEPGMPPTSAVGRTIGLLMLAGGVVFVFVLFPMPILITIWAAWLATRYARSARSATPAAA